MNKRQKIVQQAFLDDEEKVIRKLKNQYSHSLKEITKKAENLQKDIERLDTLAKLSVDDEEKEKILSQRRSKVYQKQYQDSLKKQVSDILDNMHENEYKTVSAYLDKCYEQGFLGTMYDLQGQGIPLCFPLDQEAMVRAVQTDSKISQGLYSRLGEDVSLLKRKITAQVSRGISTGMTFGQVAQQLAGVTNIGFNNAVRIARTEGHRIQCQSGMDACYKAKEKGADVVKQWDSTLDAKTRDSHVAVDGEIRELDEKFSNGLRYPSDPSGSAAEVVNCRCALLQRARWAVNEKEFTKMNGNTGELVTIKTKDFDAFKKQYKGLAAKIGGNGIPEHEEPVLLQIINPSDKNSVIKVLKNFEKSAIKENIETACVITKAGQVFKCFGTKNQVFPDFDLKDKLKGATVTHNHPLSETEFTFSKEDLQTFLDYDLDVLRGCDEKYTYEFIRDASLIDDEPDDWMNFENFGHATMIELAKAQGIGYRRWLNE